MSDNLSGPQQSDSLKYNGKYDSSKSFTPDLKLDSKAVKTEIVDLSTSKVPQPGDPDFIGPLPQNLNKPNDPISGPFDPPDSDKPIQLFDDSGNLIDSFSKDDATYIDKYINEHGDINGDGKVDIKDVTALQNGLVEKGKIPDGMGDINGDGRVTVKDATILQQYLAGTAKQDDIKGANDDVPYNDTGFVSFEDANVHYISVEQGHSGASIGGGIGLLFGPIGALAGAAIGGVVGAEQNKSDVCDTLSGCCETEDYYIISYKSGDDSKQRIKMYNKKTWEVEKEFTTDCLDHTNGLTTDGKYVYIANCAGEKQTVTKFSLDDPALDSNSEPNLETEHFDISKTSEGEKITSIAFDYTNKNVCVAAQADNLYISKPDGTILRTTKIKVPEGYPDTPQDICVANDKIYVIRTKDPAVSGFSTGQEGCNMIDIYDIDGNYIESKTLDLPGSSDSNGESVTTYRELESVSYDESTQSFTLYYTSPDYAWNKAAGNHTSPSHAVVTGVKFD